MGTAIPRRISLLYEHHFTLNKLQGVFFSTFQLIECGLVCFFFVEDVSLILKFSEDFSSRFILYFLVFQTAFSLFP